MKEYIISVLLDVPVNVRAESPEEAIELAKEEYMDWLDSSHIDDILIHTVRDI